MLKDIIVQFDTVVTNHIQQWPQWLHGPMIAITTVGNPITLCIITLITAAIAWQYVQTRIIISFTTGLITLGANTLLKHFVHRTRPDTLYVSQMWFATSSFPSGHAFGSMVILGLLGYVAVVYLSSPLHYVVPAILGTLIVAIGISRVYLGAHFPTDVLAGWLLGAITLTLIILIVKP